MYHSAIALLSNTIDYAGMFPPAKLPLHDALIQGAIFRRKANHPWLLGKIVIRFEDLKKIDSRSLFECGAEGAAWTFSVLGTPIPDEKANECEPIWQRDVDSILQWNRMGQGAASPRQIVAYETRLPRSLLTACRQRSQMIGALTSHFLGKLPCTLAYLEIPNGPGWEGALHEAATLFSKSEAAVEGRLGIKFRTGGEYRPSPRELATVISTCASSRLRFKATQGLHHALTGSHGMGFVNLITALTLSVALGNDFSINQIVDCLEDSHAPNFVFGKDHFSWRDFLLTLDQLEEARVIHAGCFGSCSLTEPDEFLKKEFLIEEN